ncbi:MAG TPA: glycosyltransferase family 2 protein [Puia sp.]|nr:glycosyltransferase family 2 protein [Puia sp.]
MPGVYIVILNYKNWQDVIACLGSVLQSDYENFTVIVIDNDSQNNSLGHLADWAGNNSFLLRSSTFLRLDSRDIDGDTDPASFPRLVFIQNEKNDGFASGNNIALRILTHQDAYIWLLNPDMIVKNDTLSELVRFSDAQPARSITGSVIKFHDRQEKVYMYGGGRIKFNSATVSLIGEIGDIPLLDYISGGSLFTKAGSFRDLGLLPENYFLYWEETDWCYRARQRGYQLNICMTAICYDKISTTIGKGFLADYYYTRNGLLFLAKYKKEAIPKALFFAGLRLTKRILAGRWARARGVYQGIHAFKKNKMNEGQ